MNQIKLSELPTLAQQLQTADYIPVVHSGNTYKYSLFDYMVKNSGNETIAGVKTFSTSPVVPTPATDMQASTKKYVDDAITGLNVGLPSGVATLDSTGKVPPTQMPQLVITDVFVVATQAAMLALTTAEQGDIAKRTDYTPAKTFILSASPASTLSNWVELTVSVDPNTPTSDQKAALAGNDGTPSASNPYATDSSLVPLEAFKLYKPAYPYALNEPCFYDGVPYKSLSADNTGHQPDVSPIYWEVTGGAGSATNVGFDVPNGQFEKGIVDWNLYADAAGIAPIDGTGGSATITIVHNTTNPLNGYGDLILTKPASNCQGNGLSTSITIDDGQLTTPAEVSFDYIVPSAYAAGYLKAYIFDVTNAVFCPCSVVDIPATFGSVSKLSTLFIPNNNSNNYRICFHVADSSSTAWTFELDNIQVGNQKTFSASAVSPWVDYTPTFTGFGTVTIQKAQWKRDGEDILLSVKFTAGTTTAVEGQMSLPNAYTSRSNVPTIERVGGATINVQTNADYVILSEASKNYVTFGISAASTYTGLAKQNGSAIMASGQSMSLEARIPCAQFSVNTVFNGMNEPFYLSNSETTINTNGVVSKTKLGIDGTPILPNSALTFYDMTLPRALLPNETMTIQIRSKLDGNWVEVGQAAVASLYTTFRNSYSGGSGGYNQQTGIFCLKRTATTVTVMFTERICASNGWGETTVAYRSWAQIVAAADGYDAWRIRIGQAGMSEVTLNCYVKCLGCPTTLANVPIIYTEVNDSHNCYDASTGIFTTKFPGRYRISAGAYNTTAGATGLYVKKNSVTQYEQLTSIAVSLMATGSTTVVLGISDTVSFNSNGAVTANTLAGMSIDYLGPA